MMPNVTRVLSFATAALAATFAAGPTQATIPAGLYDNIVYSPESDDLGGYAIRVGVIRGVPTVRFTVCEGACENLETKNVVISDGIVQFDAIFETCNADGSVFERKAESYTAKKVGQNLLLRVSNNPISDHAILRPAMIAPKVAIDAPVEHCSKQETAAREEPNSVSTEKTEATDVYIRRMAGLPASSVKGEISIVDVGHMPMDMMISIVANRVAGRWHISYVCASSPYCKPGSDHASAEYELATQSGHRIEAIITKFKNGAEPDGTPPGPGTITCGHLTVRINYNGFRHTYYRACDWGRDLSELKSLFKP